MKDHPYRPIYAASQSVMEHADRAKVNLYKVRSHTGRCPGNDSADTGAEMGRRHAAEPSGPPPQADGTREPWPPIIPGVRVLLGHSDGPDADAPAFFLQNPRPGTHSDTDETERATPATPELTAVQSLARTVMATKRGAYVVIMTRMLPEPWRAWPDKSPIDALLRGDAVFRHARQLFATLWGTILTRNSPRHPLFRGFHRPAWPCPICNRGSDGWRHFCGLCPNARLRALRVYCHDAILRAIAACITSGNKGSAHVEYDAGREFATQSAPRKPVLHTFTVSVKHDKPDLILYIGARGKKAAAKARSVLILEITRTAEDRFAQAVTEKRDKYAPLLQAYADAGIEARLIVLPLGHRAPCTLQELTDALSPFGVNREAVARLHTEIWKINASYLHKIVTTYYELARSAT